MADAIFRATPQVGTVRRVEGKLTQAARNLRRELLAEMREIEVKMEGVFEDHSPYDEDERDDYHMVDHIRAAIATAGQIRLTISIEAIDPRSGFNYLDVTRYGHRGVLTARGGGVMRWRDGSGWHAAKETSGHHPTSDWVEDARPDAEYEVSRAADRLGRSIATRVLR